MQADLQIHSDKAGHNHSHAAANNLQQQSSSTQTSGFVDNRPATVAQRKLQQQINDNHPLSKNTIDSEQQTEPGVMQRLVIKLEAPQLTGLMQQRFGEAYDVFKTTVLDASYLSKGDQNQVVLWGVSSRSHPQIKNDYGVTYLYIGSNGYTGDQYQNFSEIWDLASNDSVPSDVSFRIVIAINLTMNRTAEELYTTMLHEWHAHATEWTDLLKLIRSGVGKKEIKKYQKQGVVARGHSEHAAYSGWADEDIREKVEALGLSSEMTNKVIAKMIEDRDRYDSHSGLIK